MIKLHTALKGLIWEAIGVILLATWTMLQTGDWRQATAIGVGYPAMRAVMWYPYERLYKWLRRRKHQTKVELPQSDFNSEPLTDKTGASK